MTSLNTSSKGYSYYGTADPIFSLSTRLDLSGVPAALLDISSLSALKTKKINKHFKSEIFSHYVMPNTTIVTGIPQTVRLPLQLRHGPRTGGL